jgi:hypothetical protein
MTAPKPGRQPRRGYSLSGLYKLKRAVNALGSRAIDRRTVVGRALAEWRGALITDLGGADAITTQQEAIVDLAVKTKLILDSIDAWLLSQPSLVNHRKRCLLPAVRERTQIADALARYLAALGLERRARKVPALGDYLARTYGQPGNGAHSGAAAPVSADRELDQAATCDAARSAPTEEE